MRKILLYIREQIGAHISNNDNKWKGYIYIYIHTLILI